MAFITKQHAETIAEKLKAKMSRAKKHDYAQIYYEGKLVAQFGIRRSPRKDEGHGHVPAALHVSPNEARQISGCSKQLPDWLAIMAEKGLL